MMLRTQFHPEIEKWAGRTLLLLCECKDVNLRLVSGYYLAIHYMWVGDFTNTGMVVTMTNEGNQPEASMSLVLAAMGKNEESLNQLKLARQIGLRAKSNHIKFMCLLTAAHLAVDYGIIMRNGESENRGGVDKPCLSVPEASGGSEKQGLDALRDAMSLGREHGIVNCFGWRPDVMPRMCVHALDGD